MKMKIKAQSLINLILVFGWLSALYYDWKVTLFIIVLMNIDNYLG